MNSFRVTTLLLSLIFLFSVNLFASPSFSVGDAHWRSGIDLLIPADEALEGPLDVAGINVEVGATVPEAMSLAAIKAKTGGVFQNAVQVVAADAELGGTFEQKVTCIAAKAELSGTFNGDVTVKAAKIVLDSTAVFKGNFNYSAASLDGLDRAAFEGTVSEVPFDVPDERAEGWGRDLEKGAAIAAVISWLLSLAAIVVTALVIHGLFPNQYEAVTDTITASPWTALGVGFVVLVATPPAIVIALATIIGIPIALIAGMCYLIALYTGQLFSALWLGRTVTVRLQREVPASKFSWSFLAGILIIWLAGLVPFIGGLFGFTFTLIGLGGLWLSAWHGVKAGRGGL